MTMTASRKSETENAHASVRLLGGFELFVDLRQIPLPTQAQRVVGYLAVSQRPSRRDVLAGSLWPFSSQHRAQANLRTALWRINQACNKVVMTDHNIVRLCDNVDIDAQEVCLVARALIAATAPEEIPAASLGLLEADLLPGWDEDWLVVERERLRQLRMHALEALSRQLAGRGRYSEAIEAAMSAIAVEPLRESSRAALIEVYIAEGNASEASREMESYKSLLKVELGIEPSSRFRGLLGQSKNT